MSGFLASENVRFWSYQFILGRSGCWYQAGHDSSISLKGAESRSTNYASSFAFAPNGGLSSETFGNSMVHSMSYNRAMQVSEVKLKQSATGAELQRYNYLYGEVTQSSGTVDTSKNTGQIGRIDGTINGSSTKEWDQRFVYDELGRLSIAAEYQNGTGSTPTWQAKYTYDRYGNRFQSGTTDNFGVGFTSVVSTDVTASTNRFIASGSYPTTYDDAGNITQDMKFRLTGSLGMKYAYDANGRQTSAKLSDDSNEQTSVYDAGGQRVQTVVGSNKRTRIYDAFSQEVADYTGTTGATLDRENIYRSGQLLASDTGGTNNLKYVLQDAQGSTRAVIGVGSSPAVESRHDYLPFGEEIPTIGSRTSGEHYSATDTNRQRYGFTERDDTTGLDHTWFRKYESISGRWTSSDPYAGSMNIGSPQSFNRYVYTQNDPVNFIDPTGLFSNEPHSACGYYNDNGVWINSPCPGDNPWPDPTDNSGGHQHFEPNPAGGKIAAQQKPRTSNVPTKKPGDPNSLYCKALAQKIANIQSSIITHVSALLHNPKALDEVSPSGKISDGVIEHRDRLLGEAENLANRIQEYKDNCGGGNPPTVPPVNKPRSFRSKSTNFPDGKYRVLVPVGVGVGVGLAIVGCLLFPEVCVPATAGAAVMP